jgi:hypothetical protein
MGPGLRREDEQRVVGTSEAVIATRNVPPASESVSAKSAVAADAASPEVHQSRRGHCEIPLLHAEPAIFRFYRSVANGTLTGKEPTVRAGGRRSPQKAMQPQR